MRSQTEVSTLCPHFPVLCLHYSSYRPYPRVLSSFYFRTEMSRGSLNPSFPYYWLLPCTQTPDVIGLVLFPGLRKNP